MVNLSTLLCTAAMAVNAAQINARLGGNSPAAGFDVTGGVTFVSREGNGILALEDASGAALMFLTASPSPARGQLIRALGEIRISSDAGTRTAFCTNWTALGALTPPAPVRASEQLLQEGVLNGRLVSVAGTVTDAFRDEIDPDWIYLILDCGGELINAVAPAATFPPSALKRVIDAEAVLTGLCLGHALGARRHTGVTLYLTGERDVRVTRPAPADPFAVPDLPSATLSPAQVNLLGKRRAAGRLLAVWSGNRALLRSDDGRLTGVTFRDAPPDCGQAIEAVGYAATDLYRLNLFRRLDVATRTEAVATALRRHLLAE